MRETGVTQKTKQALLHILSGWATDGRTRASKQGVSSQCMPQYKRNLHSPMEGWQVEQAVILAWEVLAQIHWESPVKQLQ